MFSADANAKATAPGKKLSAWKAMGSDTWAGTNAAFQNDVAMTARHAYRDRWLAIREGLIEGEAG